MNNLPTSKAYLKERLNEECIRRTGYPLEEDEWRDFCKEYSFVFKVMEDYKNITIDDKIKENKDPQSGGNKKNKKHRRSSGKRKRSVDSEIPKRDH